MTVLQLVYTPNSTNASLDTLKRLLIQNKLSGLKSMVVDFTENYQFLSKLSDDKLDKTVTLSEYFKLKDKGIDIGPERMVISFTRENLIVLKGKPIVNVNDKVSISSANLENHEIIKKWFAQLVELIQKNLFVHTIYLFVAENDKELAYNLLEMSSVWHLTLPPSIDVKLSFLAINEFLHLRPQSVLPRVDFLYFYGITATQLAMCPTFKSLITSICGYDISLICITYN